MFSFYSSYLFSSSPLFPSSSLFACFFLFFFLTSAYSSWPLCFPSPTPSPSSPSPYSSSFSPSSFICESFDPIYFNLETCALIHTSAYSVRLCVRVFHSTIFIFFSVPCDAFNKTIQYLCSRPKYTWKDILRRPPRMFAAVFVIPYIPFTFLRFSDLDFVLARSFSFVIVMLYSTLWFLSYQTFSTSSSHGCCHSYSLLRILCFLQSFRIHSVVVTVYGLRIESV